MIDDTPAPETDLPLPDDAEPASARKAEDAFRTISEVAEELEIAPYVLRYWETRFPNVRPLKRAGGRRYYRPSDVALLRRIQELLHQDGFTIPGVQKLLKDSRGGLPERPGAAPERVGEGMEGEDAEKRAQRHEALAAVLADLQEIKGQVQGLRRQLEEIPG